MYDALLGSHGWPTRILGCVSFCRQDHPFDLGGMKVVALLAAWFLWGKVENMSDKAPWMIKSHVLMGIQFIGPAAVLEWKP